MSGLAGVLAGRRAPGVHHWPVAVGDPAAVAHLAQTAGWAFVHADTAVLDERRDVVGALLEALGRPGARNLDALHDVLRDLAPRTLLLWDGWATLAAADPGALGRVLRTLREVPDGVEVALRGPGPDVGLPELD